MDNTLPFMQIYANEAYVSSVGLKLEELGAVFRLRCYLWVHQCKIPDDDLFIARVLHIHTNKWRKIRSNLGGYLVKHSEGYLSLYGLQEEYRSIQEKRGELVEKP